MVYVPKPVASAWWNRMDPAPEKVLELAVWRLPMSGTWTPCELLLRPSQVGKFLLSIQVSFPLEWYFCCGPRSVFIQKWDVPIQTHCFWSSMNSNCVRWPVWTWWMTQLLSQLVIYLVTPVPDRSFIQVEGTSNNCLAFSIHTRARQFLFKLHPCPHIHDLCPPMPTHAHPSYSNCAHVFKNYVNHHHGYAYWCS